MKKLKKIIKIDTNILIIITILISTLSIIWSVAFFSKQVSLQVSRSIIENEYQNIGGKDNYEILKQIQKQEMLEYINTLKQEDPEFFYNMRQKSLLEKDGETLLLDWKNFQELKSGSSVVGDATANISLIEFSDLECSFCRDFHKSMIIDTLLEEKKGEINYLFKNFPLPKHKNSQQEAVNGKCIETLSSGENYHTYIKFIYENTLGGGEGFPLEKTNEILQELNIDPTDFQLCTEHEASTKIIEKEFEQGKKLGITITPSIVVVNNNNGKFEIVSGNVNEEILKTSIDTLLK